MNRLWAQLVIGAVFARALVLRAQDQDKDEQETKVIVTGRPSNSTYACSAGFHHQRDGHRWRPGDRVSCGGWNADRRRDGRAGRDVGTGRKDSAGYGRKATGPDKARGSSTHSADLLRGLLHEGRAGGDAARDVYL